LSLDGSNDFDVLYFIFIIDAAAPTTVPIGIVYKLVKKSNAAPAAAVDIISLPFIFSSAAISNLFVVFHFSSVTVFIFSIDLVVPLANRCKEKRLNS